jgi:hypothetical protein
LGRVEILVENLLTATYTKDAQLAASSAEKREMAIYSQQPII